MCTFFSKFKTNHKWFKTCFWTDFWPSITHDEWIQSWFLEANEVGGAVPMEEECGLIIAPSACGFCVAILKMMPINSARSITHLHYWQSSGPCKVHASYPRSFCSQMSPTCVQQGDYSLWGYCFPAGHHQESPMMAGHLALLPNPEICSRIWSHVLLLFLWVNTDCN